MIHTRIRCSIKLHNNIQRWQLYSPQQYPEMFLHQHQSFLHLPCQQKFLAGHHSFQRPSGITTISYINNLHFIKKKPSYYSILRFIAFYLCACFNNVYIENNNKNNQYKNNEITYHLATCGSDTQKCDVSSSNYIGGGHHLHTGKITTLQR